jgi:hypothetical protein
MIEKRPVNLPPLRRSNGRMAEGIELVAARRHCAGAPEVVADHLVGDSLKNNRHGHANGLDGLQVVIIDHRHAAGPSLTSPRPARSRATRATTKLISVGVRAKAHWAEAPAVIGARIA